VPLLHEQQQRRALDACQAQDVLQVCPERRRVKAAADARAPPAQAVRVRHQLQQAAAAAAAGPGQQHSAARGRQAPVERSHALQGLVPHQQLRVCHFPLKRLDQAACQGRGLVHAAARQWHGRSSCGSGTPRVLRRTEAGEDVQGQRACVRCWMHRGHGSSASAAGVWMIEHRPGQRTAPALTPESQV
jgi:hypothetical protein